MDRNNTTANSSSNESTGGGLLLGLLGLAGMALAKHLIAKAQQAPPSVTPIEEVVGSNSPPEIHTSGASNAGIDYLNQAFAIDEQRVDETRRYLGDDAAAALERANKEEYARLLREMHQGSNEAMRDIARNLRS